MSNVVVTLSESDAKWLDEFLQAEYKREGFRPHEKPKPEVQSIGAAVQRAIAANVHQQTLSVTLVKCEDCGGVGGLWDARCLTCNGAGYLNQSHRGDT